MSQTSKSNDSFLHLPVFPVNPDQSSLPGRDPDLAAKLAQAQAQLLARVGVSPVETDNTPQSNPTKAVNPLLRHGSKLAVGALLASTLLLGACGDSGPDRCTTQYVTPTAAPGSAPLSNQTPTAVQSCTDSRGSHYYSGGYYGSSHYYGSSGSSSGGFSSSGGSSSS